MSVNVIKHLAERKEPDMSRKRVNTGLGFVRGTETIIQKSVFVAVNCNKVVAGYTLIIIMYVVLHPSGQEKVKQNVDDLTIFRVLPYVRNG